MLRLTREQVSKDSGVAVATLADFEVGRRTPQPRTLAAIRTALETAGVVFTDGEEPGVKLRKVER